MSSRKNSANYFDTETGKYVKEHSSMQLHDKKLQGLMAKHTFLVFLSLLATVLFIAISLQIYWFAFLLPIDGLISAICVYFLYNFSHKYFLFCCCCNSCKCLKLQRQRRRSTMKSDGSNENVFQSEEEKRDERRLSLQNILNQTTMKNRASKSCEDETEKTDKAKQENMENTENSQPFMEQQITSTEIMKEIESNNKKEGNEKKSRRLRMNSFLESIVYAAESESVALKQGMSENDGKKKNKYLRAINESIDENAYVD